MEWGLNQMNQITKRLISSSTVKYKRISILELLTMIIDLIGFKNKVKLQGYMVDALAPEVDEGRDKLR